MITTLSKQAGRRYTQFGNTSNQIAVFRSVGSVSLPSGVVSITTTARYPTITPNERQPTITPNVRPL